MKIIEYLKSQFSGTLMTNSLFLILSSMLNSGVGFVFLVIIARIFTSEQIGFASNLITTLSVLTTISIFGLDDTIAAISTPPGEGGIGIVRLSGKQALSIADRLFKWEKYQDEENSHFHRRG